MRRHATANERVDGIAGYAANDRGCGIAYLRFSQSVIRVPFTCKRIAGLDGREVGYAALRAALHALREWGIRRVRLAVEDARLVDELSERRDVPAPMVLPYVRLRCALNEFDDAVVVLGETAELTQRARAEAALDNAA